MQLIPSVSKKDMVGAIYICHKKKVLHPFSQAILNPNVFLLTSLVTFSYKWIE